MVGFRDREFVLADIPGLIEGAHEGTGLGDRFLGHLERCGALLHLVDGGQEDVAGAYRTVRQELEAYAQGLTEKTEIVALNKVDLLTPEERKARAAALAEASGRPVLLCSGATGEGVDAILMELVPHLPPPRDEVPEAARAAYQP